MNWRYLHNKVISSAEEVIHSLLKNRDLEQDKEKFLNPDLSDIQSYNLLADIDVAVERILAAIEQEEQIFIHGDFDVDGVSATAILWDLLYRHAGAKVLPYIPSRFDEGYGLTQESIAAMREQGAKLIITVDCGIRDEKLIAAHPELDFIITDHHTVPVDESGEKQPPKSAVAVVHPMHPESQQEFEEVCGANVSWKLASAVADALGLEVDMNKYLDLVALATVCDIMPLVNENRVIVTHGLKQLAKSENVGLLKLLAEAEIKPSEVETYHFGYVLGPRINAAGRVDSAMEALKLLTTKDEAAAGTLARNLSQLNSRRQQLTQQLLEQAQAQIDKQPEDSKIFVIHGEEWPEGILGLAAGKLTEKYHRPVIVLSSDGEKLVGSARSTSAFHIADALDSLKDLLVKYGGHAQAAGLTILPENMKKFIAEITNQANETISEEQLEKVVTIDAILGSSLCNLEFYDQIQALAPFGLGNNQPIFAIPNLELLDVKMVGKQKNHLKAVFRDENQNTIHAIGFNYHNPDVDRLLGNQVSVAARLDSNTWNGHTSIQLKLVDIQ